MLPHQKINNSISIKYKNIYELFKEKCNNSQDKDFLICISQKEEIFKYKEFHKEFLIVAQYLKNNELKKGDRINIIMPNSIEFLLIYFASLTLGITVVPINQDLSSKEILYIIKDSKSKLVFYDYNLNQKIDEIKDIKTISLRKFPDFEPLKEGSILKEIPEVLSSDEAVIIYTSGTTGNPKGVVLNQLNLLSDAKAISEWFQFSKDTRTLCILPLFHNNGQIVTLLTPLYSGGSTVIIKGKISLISFWEIIEKYEINWTSVMPSILAILLSIKKERKDTTMKGIICGGQILTESVQKSFEERFKVPIFEGYGLTETTSFACFNNYPKENRKNRSIGMPLPINEMIIMDEEGSKLEQNKEGEICIRGLNVAIGYLGLSEKNKESFKNGWFHSGDFGYKDSKGYYYFKTRKDFLIIKGGENIYPAELENVLFQNPEIEECAVIGIPDDLLGEEICAFVKIKEKSGITEQELKRFCIGKIANFKQPKKIIIINKLKDLKEIPKGPTKKVLYRKLREYYKNMVNKQ